MFSGADWGAQELGCDVWGELVGVGVASVDVGRKDDWRGSDGDAGVHTPGTACDCDLDHLVGDMLMLNPIEVQQSVARSSVVVDYISSWRAYIAWRHRAECR